MDHESRLHEARKQIQIVREELKEAGDPAGYAEGELQQALVNLDNMMNNMSEGLSDEAEKVLALFTDDPQRVHIDIRSAVASTDLTEKETIAALEELEHYGLLASSTVYERKEEEANA